MLNLPNGPRPLLRRERLREVEPDENGSRQKNCPVVISHELLTLSGIDVPLVCVPPNNCGRNESKSIRTRSPGCQPAVNTLSKVVFRVNCSPMLKSVLAA